MRKLTSKLFIFVVSLCLAYWIAYPMFEPIAAEFGNSPEERIAKVLVGLCLGFFTMRLVQWLVKKIFNFVAQAG